MATIQLLHQFNGYKPGFYDFGTVENARLIALGLARDWTVNSDGGQSFDDMLTAGEVAATRALVSGAEILLTPSGDTTGAADSTAINAAIASVGALSYGGRVTLAAGQWYLNAVLQLRSGVSLKGSGKTATLVKMVNTTRVATWAWNMIYVGTENGLSSVNDWSVSDMTLDFDRSSQAGLAANIAAATDAAGNCIRIYGDVKRGTVARCRLINAVSHGLIGVQGLYDFQAYENECYGSTYRGIHLHGDSGGAYDSAFSQGRISVYHNLIHENGLLVTGAVSPNTAALTTGLFVVFDNQQQVEVSNNTVYREAGTGVQITGQSAGASSTSSRQIIVHGNNIRYCGYGLYVTNGIREATISSNVIAECGIAASGMTYSTGAGGIGILIAGQAGTDDDMPTNLTISGNVVSRCKVTGLAATYWGKGATGNARGGVVTGNIFSANGGVAAGGYTPLGSQCDMNHTHRVSFSNNVFDGTTPGTMLAVNISSSCDSIAMIGDVGMRAAGSTAINCDAPNSNLQPGSEVLGHVAQSALPDSTYFYSSTPQQYKQTYTVTNDATAWFKNVQLGSVNFVKGIRVMLLSAAGVVSNTSTLAAGFDGQSVTLINTSANSITLTGGGTTLVANIVLATQGSKYTMTYSSTIGKWA
ncbi:MAG: right-handed parallel beta-helix repeat-containing protein [Rhizobiales bacterium]|nr:right-handed parallel beta-helix repeat-containing protein [Hyphomicrobiales bacterium]